MLDMIQPVRVTLKALKTSIFIVVWRGKFPSPFAERGQG
jgi:hypothetical protein